VYAKQLSIYDFKCFGKAKLDLQYPGRRTAGASEIPNINLILGDNGGGKSSVLRALAIAVLAPALLSSGFVANRLVRRAKAPNTHVETALLKVKAQPDAQEKAFGLKDTFELLARLHAATRGSRDRLHLDSTPATPISALLDDDYSAAFFLVGYGATRRVETADYSESSARRSRGLRYQRVAGLFEDHVALRPLNSWLEALEPPRFAEAVTLLDDVLPDSIRFEGEYSKEDKQYLFDFEGAPTPFTSLSDGYKAYIGWVGDLIGHLCDVAPREQPLTGVSGIVLVDEIDLHLHPAWQRDAVPGLSRAFPRLQFVLTSHSPLVASTVKRENVFVTRTAEDGTAAIKQLEEHVFGRGAEQLLLSAYFGLTTTRGPDFQTEAQDLFKKVAEGDSEAALTYLERLTGAASSS